MGAAFHAERGARVMSMSSTKASRLTFTSVRSARRARAASPAEPIGEALGVPPQLRHEPRGLTAMCHDILQVPRARSRNTIGTSTTRQPRTIARR